MPNYLTQTEARAVWDYRDGQLYWRERANTHVPAGSLAGHLRRSDGYWHVTHKRRSYLNHRVIYLIHYGIMPLYIDHIDGDSSNNKIENLRETTLRQNAHNRRKASTNKSGMKNVSPHRGKWQVRVRANGKTCFYALVEDLELAKLIACEARDKYHADFARHQ